MTTTVTICFRAINTGSWLKPVQIIREGDFGIIRSIEKKYPKEFVYEIILETEDDPEEILNELRRNGTVAVLLLIADGHEIFRANVRNNRCDKKK